MLTNQLINNSNHSSPNSSPPLSSSFNFHENNLNLSTNNSSNIPTTKAFICEICNKAFRFRSNLAEHRSVHTAVKPFVCKFCGKSSRLKGNLTKHILKHHKNEQKDYIGTDDYIIKKGKKSVKDPAAIEFLERSMIVLNNSSSANNAKQRNSKESVSKESSVNLDNNDNNNSIEIMNTDNLFNSFGFDNSFEMKEEENNNCEPLACSSPLTPENENNKGEEQNVMSVVALMAAASSSSCPVYLENNGEDQQNEEMEEDEEEDDEIEPLSNNLDTFSPQNNSKQNFNINNNIQNIRQNNKDMSTINNAAAASVVYKALFEQLDAKTFAKALFGGGNEISNPPPNDQLLRLFSQINEINPVNDSVNQQQNKNKIEETTIPNISKNSFLATKCKHCGKSFRKPRDLLSHMATAHKLLVNGQDNNNKSAINNNVITNKPARIDTFSQQSSPSNSVFSNSSNDNTKLNNNLPEMLASELKKLRKIIFELKEKEGNNEENGSQLNLNNGGSLVRVEQILGQLDSRVCRLEKQLEMALNSIYTLVQLQTGINNNINKLNRSLNNFQNNNSQNNNNTQ
ncbi:hypothetical protein ACQ4LE_005978 [Meloidogyne hapla]|uniref:C2H2-type domain-containing protein n=1 Tax=Meloidogyne hapla TaxID=6305 RepID=A0A1I8AZ39_MELHA